MPGFLVVLGPVAVEVVVAVRYALGFVDVLIVVGCVAAVLQVREVSCADVAELAAVALAVDDAPAPGAGVVNSL